MNKTLKTILIISLILATGFIYMTQKGHNLESILNTPKSIELQVKCSKLENLLIVSTAKLRVVNTLSRTHNSVTSRVTAYDKNNNIIKQRDVVFSRTLKPKGSLSKIIRLPRKTKRCDCVLLSSITN